MVPLFDQLDLRPGHGERVRGWPVGSSGVLEGRGGQEAGRSLWEHQYPLGIKLPTPSLIPLRRDFVRGQLSLCPLLCCPLTLTLPFHLPSSERSFLPCSTLGE